MKELLNNFIHEFSTPFESPILVFGLLLFAILVIPVLFRRIKLPEIIGLIVTGIAIGPYGFGLIESDEAIELLSMIGLMYIMFIVGLELDMKEFVANKSKSLVYGLLTFLTPLTLTFVVSYYGFNYNLIKSLLVSSLIATHTLVTYPIVSKMGVANNPVVAITAGGTIFTDTAVLVLLAVLLKGNEGELTWHFFVQIFISLSIFVAIVFWVIPPISRWLFQKIGNEKYTHYIYVIFIVFLCGLLAELAGVEPIIGAFAAGLALNRLIPHTSALMNRIDFIGNSLFIPIFLISVGMLVNIGVVFNGYGILLWSGTLFVLALSSKWIAAFISQKLYKFNKTERQLMFGLSSARAAATLAIVIVGFKAGIFGEYTLNATIILILLTCIFSSLITENAAKKLAVMQENDDILAKSEANPANEKILVPIADPSNIGKHIELAMLMKFKQSENPILLLSVIPNDEDAEKKILVNKKKLNSFVEKAKATEINVETVAAIDYNVSNGIIRTARETMTNIVILGWPGKTKFLDRVFGKKIDDIVYNIDKNLFVCYFNQPLIEHKRLVVIAPPLAEREKGFVVWVEKIKKIASELSVDVLLLSSEATNTAVKAQKGEFEFMPFEQWDNLEMCSNMIQEGDIIILISAHEGYVSYTPQLDKIPTRMSTVFPDHSKIIIYPEQHRENQIAVGIDNLFTAQTPSILSSSTTPKRWRKRKK